MLLKSDPKARGERLREAMKIRGLNGKKLAAVTGINEPQISRFKNGERTKISADDVDKICAALRIRAPWLSYGRMPMDAAEDDAVDEDRDVAVDELEAAIKQSRRWAPAAMPMPVRDEVAAAARKERAGTTERYEPEDWVQRLAQIAKSRAQRAT